MGATAHLHPLGYPWGTGPPSLSEPTARAQPRCESTGGEAPPGDHRGTTGAGSMKDIMIAQWELQKSLQHVREYHAPVSRYSQQNRGVHSTGYKTVR